MSEPAASLHIARERVQEFVERVRAIRQSLHEVGAGQDTTIDLLLTCSLVRLT
jgi:hypothetical protein